MTDRVGQQLGHYRLIRVLSDRFFSRLYLGHHLQDSHPALIHVLDLFPPQAAEEAHFLAELQQLLRLRHPHLLPIRDGGIENHLPFLVMDFPSRGTLRESYPQGRQLPLLTALSSVTSLAAALEYLHQRQVAHHRLNPDEVWVGNHHQLLLSEPLTDLEHSSRSSDKLIDYVLPDEVLERECSYLAPECIEGQPGSCEAADQYALAIMVYEWLCGERFCKGSWAEIAFQQLRASPTPLRQKVSTIPPEVEEVVLRALEKDPQKRFASVQAFVAALELAASPQRLK
jgi:serine/threonine protein kinase